MSELEILTREQCLELLRSHNHGRIAFMGAEGPEVMPVNYALDDREIVIRTAPGTKLQRARMTVVAFEIDGSDTAPPRIWSVMVQGVGAEVTTALDPTSVAARRLDVRPEAPGQRDRSLAIFVERISGRSFPIEVHET